MRYNINELIDIVEKLKYTKLHEVSSNLESLVRSLADDFVVVSKSKLNELVTLTVEKTDLYDITGESRATLKMELNIAILLDDEISKTLDITNTSISEAEKMHNMLKEKLTEKLFKFLEE